jgi:hypothetical protein
VDGIVVDVSFNQLGGLFTLAFLEEVDAAIGRDHIFKRAVILVGGARAPAPAPSAAAGAHGGRGEGACAGCGQCAVLLGRRGGIGAEC